MGKSRSATVLLAYLLWASRHASPILSNEPNRSNDAGTSVPPSKPLTVIEALELLRRGRAIAEPNPGFMDQLHMYEDMNCPTTDAELKRHKLYRRWMNKRSLEEFLRVNQAPEMKAIRFEDESDSDDDEEVQEESGRETKLPPTHPTASAALAQRAEHAKSVGSNVSTSDSALASTTTSSPITTPSLPEKQITIKCRKCRHVLATTPFLVTHTPPPHRDPNSHHAIEISTLDPTANLPNTCAHIFLHPLSWMRGVLSEGAMEGRLSCPNAKCNANVGKFAWTGLRCSCGGWVTPGFGLIRGKVDEVTVGPAGSKIGPGSNGSGGGLRLPPGMVRRGNL